MARIQTPAAAAATAPLPAQRVAVYTRDTWDGEWEAARYVRPAGPIRYAVQPLGSQAALEFIYGLERQPDERTFSEHWPPDLLGKYVLFDVEMDWTVFDGSTGSPYTPLPFYGVVVGDRIHVRPPNEGVATGEAGYEVLGLEHLLRVPVVGATAVQGGSEVELAVAPTFNRRHARGGGVLGNRTAVVQASGVHAFDHVDDWWTAVWRASDIVRYLLYHYAPTRGGLTWALGGQTDILDTMEWVYRLPVGIHLDQVLNTLIDRRRGLTWIPRTDGDTITIHVASVFDQPVVLGTTTLAPNPETARIEVFTDDALDARLVETCEIRRSDAHRYRRFVALGEPMRSCFTVALADSTLEAAWTGAQETLVKSGLGDDPAANDRYRRRPHLAAAFRRFRVPAAWDWVAGDGEGGYTALANPQIRDDGTVDENTWGPYWNANKHFLNWLPIEEPSYADTGSEPSYARPFAFVRNPAEEGVYVLTHDHGLPGVPVAAVQMLDHGMGIQLHGPPQLFARGHWSGSGPTLFRGGLEQKGDHFAYDSIGATVCLETDQRLRVVHDAGGDTDADPPTLWALVPDAHLWYIIQNTVIAVDTDGTLVRHEGGAVRDDRARLELVAGLMRSWYGQPRSALRYVVRELATVVLPGTLVEALVANAWTEPVGTLCTAIVWDPDKGTTEVQTSFWDLGFATLAFDAVGVPDAKAAGREITDLWAALRQRADTE